MKRANYNILSFIKTFKILVRILTRYSNGNYVHRMVHHESFEINSICSHFHYRLFQSKGV